MERLESNQRPAGVRKLSEKESIYRIRVGDYRIVFEINDEKKTIVITRISHRKDIYR